MSRKERLSLRPDQGNIAKGCDRAPKIKGLSVKAEEESRQVLPAAHAVVGQVFGVMIFGILKYEWFIFHHGGGGAIPPQLMGILFGGVAGVMGYISLDELLPTSRAYGKGHDSLFGLVGGMLVMALSLLLMK